jgi:hypothetical protein
MGGREDAVIVYSFEAERSKGFTQTTVLRHHDPSGGL